MHLNSQAIADFPHRYRTQLINSIAGMKNASLIGTCSGAGLTNLAIVNSVFHLGAHPPLLGMIIRPDSAPRHSLENLLETGCYTINHVNEQIFRQAHQTSARYPREISEFAATGLTAAWLDGFAAPFVAESKIQLAMTYREHQSLTINQTILVIGEITAIHLPDDLIDADGFVDIEQAGSLAVIGLDSYHSTHRLARLPYAKADISASLADASTLPN